MKRNRETINILLESTILMGFSNHPSQKKNTTFEWKKKPGRFWVFCPTGRFTRSFHPFPGSRLEVHEDLGDIEIPCWGAEAFGGNLGKEAAEKPWRFNSPVWFFEVCGGYVFFVVFTFEKKCLTSMRCAYTYITCIYIYMIYNDYIHVQIESEEDSHCHGSLMLDQFLEMR